MVPIRSRQLDRPVRHRETKTNSTFLHVCPNIPPGRGRLGGHALEAAWSRANTNAAPRHQLLDVLTLATPAWWRDEVARGQRGLCSTPSKMADWVLAKAL